MSATTTSTPSTTRTATRVRLFTPGPVEIPVRILRALSAVPPHHRTDVFRACVLRVTAMLQELHGTQGEVFLLSASGSGAMEAAVVNLMAPGEKALAIVGGKFGERWMNLLKAYGLPHEVLAVEWGHAVDPAEVEKRLAADRAITTVFSTHSETSTGAIHDIEKVAGITRARGVRLIVDAITSVGVHPLPQDAWGVDVVVCGSQKGLMIPPGLATLSLAPWAAAAIEGEKLPRFYFDLRKARKTAPAGETPWTPPVSLILALEEALTMILREEGLAEVQRRHRRLASATRAGAQAIGFRPFANPPSHGVTSLVPPEGVDASAVVKRLRDVHAMYVAGGQDHLKGKILRVGHMGGYDFSDIVVILGALEECVSALGRPASGAIEAARAAWDRA
jgi:aspartate aminotransferase-like enzyme